MAALEVWDKNLENLRKKKKKCNIETKCGFEPVYSSFTVKNVTPSAAAANTQITELYRHYNKYYYIVAPTTGLTLGH